jgi:5'-3' exonuclease
MSKSNLLIVDTSYYIFYKINAIKKCMGYKDINLETYESLTDCQEYMDCYNSSFFNQLVKITKKFNIREDEIIFARDGSSEDIYRKHIYDGYKATRDYSNFNGKLVFKHTYENLLPKYSKSTVLRYPKLEADDIVAIITKHFSSKYNILIVTNDNDYLQLFKYPVQIINLKLDDLSKRITLDYRYSLMTKIILGDKSDNIPKVFPRCGEKRLRQYYDNEELLFEDLKLDKKYATQYKINKLLVDFDMIPKILVDQVLDSLKI